MGTFLETKNCKGNVRVISQNKEKMILRQPRKFNLPITMMVKFYATINSILCSSVRIRPDSKGHQSKTEDHRLWPVHPSGKKDCHWLLSGKVIPSVTWTDAFNQMSVNTSLYSLHLYMEGGTFTWETCSGGDVSCERESKGMRRCCKITFLISIRPAQQCLSFWCYELQIFIWE